MLLFTLCLNDLEELLTEELAVYFDGDSDLGLTRYWM